MDHRIILITFCFGRDDDARQRLLNKSDDYWSAAVRKLATVRYLQKQLQTGELHGVDWLLLCDDDTFINVNKMGSFDPRISINNTSILSLCQYLHPTYL